jgi:hypothetical protein
MTKPGVIAELQRQAASLKSGTLQNATFNSANYSISVTATKQGNP